jgi:hypothetical protein
MRLRPGSGVVAQLADRLIPHFTESPDQLIGLGGITFPHHRRIGLTCWRYAKPDEVVGTKVITRRCAVSSPLFCNYVL